MLRILMVLAATTIIGTWGQLGFSLPKLPKLSKLPKAELDIAGNKISLEKLFGEEWKGFKVRLDLHILLFIILIYLIGKSNIR